MKRHRPTFLKKKSTALHVVLKGGIYCKNCTIRWGGGHDFCESFRHYGLDVFNSSFFNHRQRSIRIKHTRQRLDILYSCITVPSRMLQLEASNSRCRPFLAFETATDWISLTCKGADAQYLSDALSKRIHMWVFKARFSYGVNPSNDDSHMHGPPTMVTFICCSNNNNSRM